MWRAILMTTLLAVFGGCTNGVNAFIPEADGDGDGDADGDIDPCFGVTCSDHGSCAADGTTASCVCDDGFYADGLACVPESLRVLFLVDSSESMNIVDPADSGTGEPRRVTAIRAAVAELMSREAESIGISIVRFSSEAQVLTFSDVNGSGSWETGEGYFASSATQLIGDGFAGGVVGALNATDRTGDYFNALSLSHTIIRDELELQELSSPSAPQTTRYELILVGDFLPSSDTEITNEDMIDAVAAIVELTELHEVSYFSMECVALLSGRAEADAAALGFALELAGEGLGEARGFGPAEELNLLFGDL